MAQSIGLDTCRQRLWQPIVKPVFRGDILIRQRIGQANRVARHDGWKWFARQKIRRAAAFEARVDGFESYPKQVSPQHLRESPARGAAECLQQSPLDQGRSEV